MKKVTLCLILPTAVQLHQPLTHTLYIGCTLKPQVVINLPRLVDPFTYLTSHTRTHTNKHTYVYPLALLRTPSSLRPSGRMYKALLHSFPVRSSPKWAFYTVTAVSKCTCACVRAMALTRLCALLRIPLLLHLVHLPGMSDKILAPPFTLRLMPMECTHNAPAEKTRSDDCSHFNPVMNVRPPRAARCGSLKPSAEWVNTSLLY